MVFVIQRADAEAFTPHDVADPLLGATLREAQDAGVAVWAYRCDVTERSIELADAVPGSACDYPGLPKRAEVNRDRTYAVGQINRRRSRENGNPVTEIVNIVPD